MFTVKTLKFSWLCVYSVAWRAEANMLTASMHTAEVDRNVISLAGTCVGWWGREKNDWPAAQDSSSEDHECQMEIIKNSSTVKRCPDT